jgi:hypothetical protein
VLARLAAVLLLGGRLGLVLWPVCPQLHLSASSSPIFCVCVESGIERKGAPSTGKSSNSSSSPRAGLVASGFCSSGGLAAAGAAVSAGLVESEAMLAVCLGDKVCCSIQSAGL